MRNIKIKVFVISWNNNFSEKNDAEMYNDIYVPDLLILTNDYSYLNNVNKDSTDINIYVFKFLYLVYFEHVSSSHLEEYCV